jgi:hypothetical protein
VAAVVGVAAGPQAAAARPRTITEVTSFNILLFIFNSYLYTDLPSKG